MKLILFAVLVMTLLLTGTLAQAQVRLATRVGLNLATVNVPQQHSIYSNTARVGFQGGLLLDWPITKTFSLQPALLVSSKGTDFYIAHTNYQTGVSSSSPYLSVKLVYAEVPVLALFKAKLGQSCRVYGGLGPYLGIGIGGKLDSPLLYLVDTSIPFGSGRYPSFLFRRLDYGASLATGIDVKRWQFGFTYNRGLIGVGTGVQEGYNQTLSMTVGVWLIKP